MSSGFIRPAGIFVPFMGVMGAIRDIQVFLWGLGFRVFEAAEIFFVEPLGVTVFGVLGHVRLCKRLNRGQ